MKDFCASCASNSRKLSELWLLLAVFVTSGVNPLFAQDTNTVSQVQPGPGPGKELPKNSEVTPAPDLTGLRERALYVSDQIKEQSKELAGFFAILALIYAGYHAQFRGLEEFVSTLVRIVVAFALITSFKEILPYFFDARRELIASLPFDAVDATAQVGTMMGTIGLGTILMGPVGIGLAVATLLAALGILLVYSAQILFEAILVSFGPLAIACLAFRHTTGIFTAWLKTFLAVLLVPVGWTIGMILGSNIYGWNGNSVTENAVDLAASLIYTAAAGAIYMGMPIVTVWLVNKASGAAAAAMPSPIQWLSSYISGRAAGGSIMQGSLATATGSASPGLPGNSGSNMTITSSTVTPGAAPALSGSYGERIRTAQKHHKP